MALFGLRLSVAIPDTVLEEKESPREKTAKLGSIARACAIYGVDAIEIFRAPHGRGEGSQMRRVLEYLETPQYLRKRLFPIDEALKYAGVLPPLRIPSHRGRVPIGALHTGEFLEGVVNKDGTADVGLDASLRLLGRHPPEGRVTVRVVSTSPLAAEAVPRDRVDRYWGYRVETKAAEEVFATDARCVRVATSRFGRDLDKVAAPLASRIRRAGGVKLVFGSPASGLYDMFGRSLEQKADFVLNLFPQQHVETVRTEEALFAGLSLLSFLSAIKP